MARQRKKNKASASLVQPKRLQRILSSSIVDSALDIIGIRPFQKDAPLTPQQKSTLSIDLVIAFIIFIGSTFTRFYRLAVPDKLVFDELHFAAFIHQYIKGTYLFDIHPPLGKLTLVAVAKFFGYDPIDFSFDTIGKPFGDLMFYPQRAFAAIAGSLIPSVMYLTARSLSLSTETSIATAAMPLFDILLCIESRLILTDSQLILYLQLAYFFAFLLWQTPRSTPRRYLLLVATAAAAACALSTKWTAFVAPLVIMVVSLTGIIFPYARLDILEMGVAGIIAVVIYIGCFWIHFKLLPLSGPGDAFMRHEFQTTLVGNKQYNPNAPAVSFPKSFWYLNWEMLRANSAIETRHPWESKWYEWLYNARGVLYSDENNENGLKERVYIIVNPVLSILTNIGVVVSLIFICVRLGQLVSKYRRSRRSIEEELEEEFSSLSTSSRRGGRDRTRRQGRENDGEKEDKLRLVEQERKKGDTEKWSVLILMFVAWCANLFPYIGIKRCTFVYHVLPSLQISSLMTGIMLNVLPRKYGIRAAACLAVIISLGAAFYHWRSWVYALPRTEEELVALRLMPRWH